MRKIAPRGGGISVLSVSGPVFSGPLTRNAYFQKTTPDGRTHEIKVSLGACAGEEEERESGRERREDEEGGGTTPDGRTHEIKVPEL